MSTSLILLIPVVLFGIVGMFCFVGCWLPVEGLPNTPFTEYTAKTVLSEPSIMAYWPLNDALTKTDNPAPAVERVSKIPSHYIDKTTAPQLYDWPPFPVQITPVVNSAGAGGGAIDFGQLGLVKGDAVVPAIPSIIQPCIVVNGCYMEAPFDPKFVPQGNFTVEAWVRVDWTIGDPDAWRFVLDMRDFEPNTGIALFAKTEDDQPHVYRWAGMVGNGGASTEGFTILPSNELKITLSSPGAPADPVHLALTFNGQTLTLFVNGEAQGSGNAVYMPNTAQPLWIGAGAPFVTRRPMQAAGALGSPLFPFVGAIQDVAIYSEALDANAILRHFNNGMGTNPA